MNDDVRRVKREAQQYLTEQEEAAFRHDQLMQEIDDEVSMKLRTTAALKLVENLTTEDIELVNDHFPHLAECALHEILNRPKPVIQKLGRWHRLVSCSNGLTQPD